jgi:dihydrofolate synthase/folylpolyglutamate synthase
MLRRKYYVDAAAERLAPLLAQLVNYERTRPDRRLWDLTTMHQLLARPAATPALHPAVQVGGSKGKGTTAAQLAAFAAAAGCVAGLYTSPHVTTLLERIRIDGRDIDCETLAALLPPLLRAASDRPPTFFEAMTLAAREWFAQSRVDLAIYEVGLGGRHDATTALPVDASIVTMIELEHTEVLGGTEALIAAEKAPVIRPGGHGFTGATGAALAVIRAHCAQIGAGLAVLGEQFGLRDVTWAADGARGRLWLPGGLERSFWLPQATAFELPALALAAAAFWRLLPAAPLQLDPVPRPQLPCRFEVFAEPDGEVLVLDGAHTERSLAMVAAELARRWPGHRAAVLFASAAGKRWREGLSALLPTVDSFVVTELTGTTSEAAATIAAHLATVGARCDVAPDVATGLQLLRSRPGPRLVVGSFYLAGQVRQSVVAHQPSLR